VESHLELGDHAEVSAATAQSPKEIRIFRCAGVEDRTICDDKGKAFDVVAGETVQAVQPSGASAKDQSSRAGMGNNPGRKGEPDGLGHDINATEKAATTESRAAIYSINTHLPHAGEIDHQTAFTTAESGKAVTATTDGGNNARGTRRSDCSLHIRHSGATGDQTRRAGNHSVPDAPCFGKFGVPGTQQVSAKLTV